MSDAVEEGLQPPPTTIDDAAEEALAGSSNTSAVSKSALSLFKSLLTRAMTEAEYVCTGSLESPEQSAKATEHYGLGLEYYTHFTSPIRRYADLVVHRLLLAADAVEKARGRLVQKPKGDKAKEGAEGTGTTSTAVDVGVRLPQSAAPELGNLVTMKGQTAVVNDVSSIDATAAVADDILMERTVGKGGSPRASTVAATASEPEAAAPLQRQRSHKASISVSAVQQETSLGWSVEGSAAGKGKGGKRPSSTQPSQNSGGSGSGWGIPTVGASKEEATSASATNSTAAHSQRPAASAGASGVPSAPAGNAPPDAPPFSTLQLTELCDHLNVQNRNAKVASEESNMLFLAIYFKVRWDPNLPAAASLSASFASLF